MKPTTLTAGHLIITIDHDKGGIIIRSQRIKGDDKVIELDSFTLDVLHEGWIKEDSNGTHKL